MANDQPDPSQLFEIKPNKIDPIAIFKHLSDDGMKQLAADVKAGLVFTDRHIKAEDGAEALDNIFLPLPVIAGSVGTDFSKIGLIYEYNDKAGETNRQGYPTFSSVNFLSREDTEKVVAFYQALP